MNIQNKKAKVQQQEKQLGLLARFLPTNLFYSIAYFSILFSAILFLSNLMFVASASAFIFVTSGGFNTGERAVSEAPVWESKTFEIVLNRDLTLFGGSITPEISSDDFETALIAAIRAWDHCGLDFKISFTTGTTGKSTSDGINVMMWDNRTTGEGNLAASTSTLAFAVPVTSNNALIDCDIVVNGEAGVSTDFGIDGASNKFDLISVLVHEIGHCLGIDHPVSSSLGITSESDFLNDSVMFPSISTGSTTGRIIEEDELDAMGCMYPLTGNLRTGGSCASYHGTSGGGTLSGVVTGGPTTEDGLPCGDSNDIVTTQASAEEGKGCVSSTIASDGKKRTVNHPQDIISWILSLAFLYFLTISTTKVFSFMQRKAFLTKKKRLSKKQKKK